MKHKLTYLEIYGIIILLIVAIFLFFLYLNFLNDYPEKELQKYCYADCNSRFLPKSLCIDYCNDFDLDYSIQEHLEGKIIYLGGKR